MAHVAALTNGGTKTFLSAAETAKLVRTALKHAFPGTKFSVRSETYSGGASINVKWTDGPTRADVDVVVRGYAGSGFDGMQDLKYSYSHWLLPDGTTVVAHSHHNLDGGPRAEKPHPDAVRVHFGADFIFTTRELSETLMVKAAAVALRDYALGPHVPITTAPTDLVEVTKYGPRWAVAFANKAAWENGGTRWVSDVLSTAAARLRGDGTITHDVNGRDLLAEAAVI